MARMTTQRLWNLTVENHPMYVPPSIFPVHDPKWEGVDSHGHPHSTAMLRQTTEARYGEPWFCLDCNDGHEDFLGYFCTICGDKVEPRLVPDHGHYIPGLTEATLEVNDSPAPSVIRTQTWYVSEAFTEWAFANPEAPVVEVQERLAADEKCYLAGQTMRGT